MTCPVVLQNTLTCVVLHVSVLCFVQHCVSMFAAMCKSSLYCFHLALMLVAFCRMDVTDVSLPMAVS